MRAINKLSVFLLIGLIFSHIAAEDYYQWNYSMKCIINTETVGVTENVTDFPLLIRLTEANSDVFDNANENGEDIRFSKEDGITPLSYQIEKWDKANKVAHIWVKVDVIEGSSSEQFIKMYWGNTNATSESAGSSVFGSIDYAGVWHLSSMDDASGPGGSEHDGVNYCTEYVSGIIGDAVDFSGQDWIDISTSAFSNINNQITIELWQYGDPYYQPQNDRLVWAWDAYGYRALNIVIPWSDEYVVFDAGNSYNYFNRIEKMATSSEYEGQWNHWVFIKDATEGSMRIYLNGSLWHSEESGNTFPINIESGFRLGADHCGSQNYDGHLDEFRVSNISRSAAWAKLSYENQKHGQAVVTFEDEIGGEYKCPRNACIGDKVLIDGPIKFKIDAVYSDDNPDPKPDQPILHHATAATGLTGIGDGFRLVYDANFLTGNHPTDDVLRIEKTDGNQLNPDGGIAFVNVGKENDQYKSETALFIKGDGKIGVGTDDPKTTFNVKQSHSAQPTVLIEQLDGYPNLALVNSHETIKKGMRFEYNTLYNELRIQTCNEDGEYVSNAPEQVGLVAAFQADGNVGIGTTEPGDYKLAVNGKIKTREVVVTAFEWSDYVFEDDYDLKSLEEVEKYIKENKHLPGIPTEKEVKEKGLSVGDMQAKLLEKIEEMTLYIINLKKENKELENRILNVQKKIKQ